MIKYIFCFFILTSTLFSHAQIKTWNADGDGISWSDANNWNPVGVPTSNNVVLILSDSVRAIDDIHISRLVLDGNAILNYDTTPSFEFVIDNSNQDGLLMLSNSRFYINGKISISNSLHTGLKMEANSQLLIGNDGILEIEQVGENGLLGSLNSVIKNYGEISVETYGDDGFTAFSLENYGSVNIAGGGLTAAKIGGAGSKNEGQMNFEGSVLVFPSTTFTNEVSASFISSGLVGISGTFHNKGTFLSKSLSTGSLSVASNGDFHNWGQLSFKYSNTHNIVLDGNADLINHENGVIENIDSTATAQEGVFAISLLAAGTSLINDGLINLNLNNAREGIKLLNGGQLSNAGILNINNYYKTGLSSVAISSSKTTVENIKSAKLSIGIGATNSSKALVIGDKNTLFNDECADFVIQDSLELTGTSGTQIYNAGYMQIDGIMKDAVTDFDNTGALYLSSALLESGLPPGYINQFGNGGLIYAKNPLEITDGVAVSPLFAGFHASAAAYLSNIQVMENGALVPAGDLDALNNYWKPNMAGVREDTVYVTYTLGECAARVLKLPFYKNPVWDCGSAPAANVTFLGSIDTDWHTPDNWSNNEIPRACDSVIVPNGERCEIAPSTTAEAKSILVETGAYFLAPPGVLAEFDPN